MVIMMYLKLKYGSNSCITDSYLTTANSLMENASRLIIPSIAYFITVGMPVNSCNSINIDNKQQHYQYIPDKSSSGSVDLTDDDDEKYDDAADDDAVTETGFLLSSFL